MEGNKIKTVNEVVWPWRQPLGEKPKKKGAWKRSLIQSLVISIVAGLMFYWGHKVAAGCIWIIAGVILLCGIVIPSVYEKIERFGQRLGRWVGMILTWVLLVPFFYLIFWPSALFFKKRDAENFSQGLAGDADSYWTQRSRGNTNEQYKRQF